MYNVHVDEARCVLVFKISFQMKFNMLPCLNVRLKTLTRYRPVSEDPRTYQSDETVTWSSLQYCQVLPSDNSVVVPENENVI